MKTGIFLLVLLMTGSAFADSVEIRQFLFTGAETSKTVNMSTEETRTEYITERVPATCYRTVTRRRCYNERVCDRRRVCRVVRRCVPETRRVPYRCMRQVTRAIQVHDFYVETTANFDFAATNDGDFIREEFQVKMVGQNSDLSVNASNNYFLVLDREQRLERREAGVKYVTLNYKVRLVNAANARSVLGNGIENVRLDGSILTFSLGAGFNFNEFAQQIRIFQNRRFGSDPLILNKYLSGNEMDVQSTANSSHITIDLKQLGVNLPSNMRIILDTRYNIDENKLLNRGEIDLHKTANWIFR